MGNNNTDEFLRSFPCHFICRSVSVLLFFPRFFAVPVSFLIHYDCSFSIIVIVTTTITGTDTGSIGTPYIIISTELILQTATTTASTTTSVVMPNCTRKLNSYNKADATSIFFFYLLK